MRTILHLTGSAVSDFYADLSRTYAVDALAALADPDRYAFRIAHVTPDGRWRFPADLARGTLDATPSVPPAEAIARIAELGVDLVVPQMFCRPGMTSYRALFDVLGVPVLGNTAEAMALGADKSHARAVVAAAGVDVPPGELVRPGERPSLMPPVVVKPVDADNSDGVTLVTEDAGYPAALEAAWRHAGAALVERYVELGREVRCGVIERGGELVVLPLEEYAVDTASRPIRRAADKVARGADGEIALMAKTPDVAWPVDPDDPVTERVGALARRCHVALGGRHYSLVDVRVDPAGRPWFLEAGLYCSFAPASVVAVMARAAGIELTDLFASMVDQACRQAND